MKKELSVLIPFKNEKEELARTCKSVRDTAGDRVDIIVLNDASEQGFDYEGSVKPYDVRYYESKERLGSSLGKQRCVELCETPYFLILDSHCRIYTEDWLDRALAILHEDEGQLGAGTVYCCKVQYFSNEQDHRSPQHMSAYGGFWDYNIKSLFSCGWNLNRWKEDEPFEIPCLLGANYLCSKRWWNYLKGYEGLRLYGREETYISWKSRMAGGSVKCIPTIHTGHKTRPGNRQPYQCCVYEIVHNEMVILYTLRPEMWERVMECWKYVYNPQVMQDATRLFLSHKDELDALREYYQGIRRVSNKEIDRFNAAFQKKMGWSYERLKKDIKGTFTGYGQEGHKAFPIG